MVWNLPPETSGMVIDGSGGDLLGPGGPNSRGIRVCEKEREEMLA